MVNAAKRMRALTYLLKIKAGPGAIVLPPPPKPQVQSIYMRLPTGQYCGLEYYKGAREFWRGHLQRLKFANPSLLCNVETVRSGEKEPMYMSITYESADEQALSNLDLKFPNSQQRIRPEVRTRKEGDEEIKEKSPVPSEIQVLPDPESPPMSQKILSPVKMTPEIRSHAPKDEITAKPQPASIPSAPQTTKPPETIYTRTVTLPLGGLRDNEIWLWMRQHLDLPHKTSFNEQDSQAWGELKRFRTRADQDRQRVKTGVDAMKREQMELKRAREAAAKMAAEV